MYRQSPAQSPELVGHVRLRTPHNGATAATLIGVGACIALFGVSLCLSLPRPEAFAIGVVFAGMAIAVVGGWVQASRVRRGAFVHDGMITRLVIDRGPELELPIALRGAQKVITRSSRAGARNFRCLALELRDAHGRCLEIQELRDDDGERAWPDGLESPSLHADYVVDTDELAALRALIEKLNRAP